MYTTKKYPFKGDALIAGPISIPCELIVLYIISGQFSRVANANKVIIAYGTLSKL